MTPDSLPHSWQAPSVRDGITVMMITNAIEFNRSNPFPSVIRYMMGRRAEADGFRLVECIVGRQMTGQLWAKIWGCICNYIDRHCSKNELCRICYGCCNQLIFNTFRSTLIIKYSWFDTQTLGNIWCLLHRFRFRFNNIPAFWLDVSAFPGNLSQDFTRLRFEECAKQNFLQS